MTRRNLAAAALLVIVALSLAAWRRERSSLGSAAPLTTPSVLHHVQSIAGAASRPAWRHLTPILTHIRRPASARRSPVVAPQSRLAAASAAHQLAMMAAPLRVDGPPSVSSALLDATLARLGSPLAGLGRYIVARGRFWGVDPVFLLAFVAYFDHGAALPPRAHNVGHIRAAGGQPSLDGYRAYASWQAGIDGWYSLIRNLYVGRWRLRTLDAIVPVYAPDRGRRGVEAEVNALRAMVGAWRSP